MATASNSVIYTNILVPFDGSEGATKALRKALLLARAQGARITAFSVDEHVPGYAPGVGRVEELPELRQEHLAELRGQALDLAREYGVEPATAAEVGHAAQTILGYAGDHEVDLIVIGQTGHSGIWGTLLGSTTKRVVDHASCDVLVVR